MYFFQGQALLVWLMWSEKEVNQLDIGLTTWPCLDYTHELNLEVSRLKFDIALSQEWEGQLTWYKRDMSRPFMTVTLTFVGPWWGSWMYRIVTGLTSDVGVPSTYLVPSGSINSNHALVQIVTWWHTGDKPLFKPELTMISDAICRPGVGVTKPISSVPLFSDIFNIVKTHIMYRISRLYLAGVAAAQLRWHLPNMNVIQRT